MMTVKSEEDFLTELEFSKLTENLETPWLDDTWTVVFR